MMYAEVKQLSDRYSVDIYPDDLSVEVLTLTEVDENLNELGYVTKSEVQIDEFTWHIVLDDRTVKEKVTNGYGLIIDYYKVGEVVSVLNSGRSKDGKNLLPVPGSELAKKSRQVNNAIVYQNKDYFAVWSNNKQTLDTLRKKTIEWRRNHTFKIERFL